MRKQTGNTKVIFVIIALTALYFGIAAQKSSQLPKELPELKSGVLLPKPKMLISADLLDHNSQVFITNENFKGKWNILFFGFTHCPDVCPTTLQQLKQVKQSLQAQEKWGNYRVVFVSVDPERDTPGKLKSYVPFFDKEFIGLTGEQSAINDFAKQLGIISFKGEKNVSGGYEVDHGASIILINPEGQMAGVATAPHNVNSLTEDLSLMYDFFTDGHKNVTNNVDQNTSNPSKNLSTETAKLNSKQLLQIKNAWIRPAPPGAVAMAAYFDLENTSNEAITLVKANSDAFNMAMIHQSVIENNVAKMNQLSELMVPAQQTVSFQPQGIHLMLMQPKEALSLGDTVNISLTSNSGELFNYKVSVRELAK